MTYLVQDIRDHLAGSVNIVNDVGNHIYPEVIPQKTQYDSAIVINDITATPEYALKGEVGLHTSRIQIDYWTNNGSKYASNLGAELIRNRLSGYRGQFGTGCYGTSRILENNSLAAAPFDASDNHQRRVSMDFEIIHSAAVPTFT